MHLGMGDDQGILYVLDVESEQGPAPDDLQRGQHYSCHIDLGDEDVTSDLANVLQEAEVHVCLL